MKQVKELSSVGYLEGTVLSRYIKRVIKDILNDIDVVSEKSGKTQDEISDICKNISVEGEKLFYCIANKFSIKSAEMFVLRYRDRLTYREIGKRYEVSMSVVSRAIKLIEEHVKYIIIDYDKKIVVDNDTIRNIINTRCKEAFKTESFKIYVDDLITIKVTDMSNLFKNKKVAEVYGLYNWSFENVENIDYMFKNSDVIKISKPYMIKLSERLKVSDMINGSKLNKLYSVNINDNSVYRKDCDFSEDTNTFNKTEKDIRASQLTVNCADKVYVASFTDDSIYSAEQYLELKFRNLIINKSSSKCWRGETEFVYSDVLTTFCKRKTGKTVQINGYKFDADTSCVMCRKYKKLSIIDMYLVDDNKNKDGRYVSIAVDNVRFEYLLSVVNEAISLNKESILKDLYNTKTNQAKLESSEILSKEEEFIYGLIPSKRRKEYGDTPKEIVKNYIMNSKSVK